MSTGYNAVDVSDLTPREVINAVSASIHDDVTLILYNRPGTSFVAADSGDESDTLEATWEGMLSRMRRGKQLQVAYLQGTAGAFGLSLMLAVDFTIADSGASVKIEPHLRQIELAHLGLLQPFVGIACAQQLLLDGERMDRNKLIDVGLAVGPQASSAIVDIAALVASRSSNAGAVAVPGLRAYLVRRETLLRAPVHKAVEYGHAATAQAIQATYKQDNYKQRAPYADLQAALNVRKNGKVLQVTIPHLIQDAKISELMASFKSLAAASANDDVEVVYLDIQGSDDADAARLQSSEYPAEVSGKDAVEVCRWFSKWERIYDVMHGLPKCTVARCSGILSQAQLEIAAMCDLRSAAPDMSAWTHPGLVLPATACIMLARQVGVMRARLVMLGLVPLDAASAASWGFVSTTGNDGIDLSKIQATQYSRLDTIRANLDIAWNLVVDNRGCGMPVVKAFAIPGTPAEGIAIDPSKPVMKDDKTKRPAFVEAMIGSSDSDSDSHCLSMDTMTDYLCDENVFVQDRRDSDHGMRRSMMRPIIEDDDEEQIQIIQPSKKGSTTLCLPIDGVIDKQWLERALPVLVAASVTVTGSHLNLEVQESDGLWDVFLRRLHNVDGLKLKLEAESVAAISPRGMQIISACVNIDTNTTKSVTIAAGGAEKPIDILTLLPVQAVGYAKMMELILLDGASAPASRLLPSFGFQLDSTEKMTNYVMSFPPALSEAYLNAPKEPKRAPQSGIMGVGCAVPNYSYDQEEVASRWFGLSPADPTTRIFRASSIATRFFSVAPEEVQGFEEKDAGDLAKEHGKNATTLGSEAISAACKDAGIELSDVAMISVCTSTGLLLPGLTAHIANALGLDPQISRVDIVGMGCSAGLNAIQAASRWVAAEKAFGEPGYAVALAVEVCSAAHTWNQADGLNDSVVNSLFADGAAAVVVGLPHQSQHCKMLMHRSLCIPDTLKALYYDWDSTTSRFRFMLSPSIPYVMGTHASSFVAETLERAGLSIDHVSHWVIHGGGKKVILSMMHNLGLGAADVLHTDEVMRNNGNMSSPSFLFSFERLVKTGKMKSGQYGMFMTMGPGAAVECCVFQV